MEDTQTEIHPNISTRDKTSTKNELPLTTSDEHLKIPVQESQHISAQPIPEQEKPKDVFKTCDSQKVQDEHETCGDLPESKTKKNHGDPSKEVAPDLAAVPVAKSEVMQFTSNPLKIPAKFRWESVSERWEEKFNELVNEREVTRVGSMVYVNRPDFLIAKESDDIEVFLGLRDDGTEVAIKKIIKSKDHILKNEEGFLRISKLDYTSIVRYVDVAEDEGFRYLALQLCEYNLEEHRNNGNDLLVKSLVKGILMVLRMLHHHDPPILHGNLTRKSVFIDVHGKPKLAGFHKSRCLVIAQTPSNKGNAETKGWMIPEILKDENEIQRKLSGDIQMLGMLMYYVLTGGHYPSGKGYALDHIQDLVARDLIERMINEDTKKKLTVEECLRHPFFWPTERWDDALVPSIDEPPVLYSKEEYLRRFGNRKEVKKYKETDPELISALDRNGSFTQWKSKFPKELEIEHYSENAFGLLRCYRNLCEHPPEDAAQIDLMKLFPDLFGCVYKFAESQGWNSEPPLNSRFFFTSEETGGTTRNGTKRNQEECLTVAVQDSQQSFTQPAANY